MKKYWILHITITTFILSLILGILSEISLRNVNVFFAFLTLLLLISIGVFFDMVGIAVATADSAPFHSMAARKVKGAKKAVDVVKHAGIVSNFCNDVVGDISGIISGVAVVIIFIKLSEHDVTLLNVSLISVTLTALTAALTVGGKALGKYYAMKHWKTIVYRFALVIEFLETKLSFKII